MTSNRKLLGAAAFALALAGGGAAGALLGTPNVSGAQDETDDTTTTDTEATAFEHGPGRHGFGGEALETAAEVLGLSEEDLRTQLADGAASIAQVAEAQGVDVQAVVDALVANATERLEEIEAELPERMADLVNREGWGDGPGRHHLLGEGLDAAAEALGLEADALRDQLAEGATLAEVAEAQGVDVQVVIDALVAEATTHIDEAVADGRLDADEAEELKSGLVDRITERVNEGGPFGGGMRGGMGGGRHHMG